MREGIKDLIRIEHMLEAIDDVNTLMAEKNLASLESDKMLYFAVIKNIEIIGEAVYKLSR